MINTYYIDFLACLSHLLVCIVSPFLSFMHIFAFFCPLLMNFKTHVTSTDGLTCLGIVSFYISLQFQFLIFWHKFCLFSCVSLSICNATIILHRSYICLESFQAKIPQTGLLSCPVFPLKTKFPLHLFQLFDSFTNVLASGT